MLIQVINNIHAYNFQAKKPPLFQKFIFSERFNVPYFIALKRYAGNNFSNPNGEAHTNIAQVALNSSVDCVVLLQGSLRSYPCTQKAQFACEKL